MTEYSYPNSNVANQIVTDESKHLAFGPDAIVSGLDVSLVGANVVRLGPGFARCGGWGYENNDNLDFTVGTNGASNPRVDRLVLRKAWDAGTSLVQVRAAVKQGAAAATPVYPALTKTPGAGISAGRGPDSVYEIPVALWAVNGGGSSAAINYRTNGPGPGAVSWDVHQDVPTATVYGWPLAYRPTGLGNHGPQPVTWQSSDRTLPVLIGGIYAVSYSVYVVGAGATSTSYIRLDGPGGFSWESGFDQRDRAQINMQGWMDAGEFIAPTVYQNTGITRNAILSLAVARLA